MRKLALLFLLPAFVYAAPDRVLDGQKLKNKNVTWTLPTADGTSAQCLLTNGSKLLSFGDCGGGGGGPFSSLTIDGGSGNPFNVFSSSGVSESFFGQSGSAVRSFVMTWHDDASPRFVDLHLYGVDNLITLHADNKVKIHGITYPSADGAAQDCMKTDGAGNLSFGSCGFDGNNIVGSLNPATDLGGGLGTNGKRWGESYIDVLNAADTNRSIQVTARQLHTNQNSPIFEWSNPNLLQAYKPLDMVGNAISRVGPLSVGGSEVFGKVTILNVQATEDLVPAISIRNATQPTLFGFDIMHRVQDSGGDLVFNRISSGVSSEALRINRDSNRIQIGQSDTVSAQPAARFVVSGQSNNYIAFFRSEDGSSNGGLSIVTTPTKAVIQGVRSDDASNATLHIQDNDFPLLLGNPLGSVSVKTSLTVDGHIITSGSAPALACGTGASNAGNDATGRITAGNDVVANVTDCVITFTKVWVNAPHCDVRSSSGGAPYVPVGALATTTTLTLPTGYVQDNDLISYHCVGYE